MLKRLFVLFAALPVFAVACGDHLTGPEATTEVVVRFAGAGSASATAARTGPTRAPAAAQPPLVVEGTNGTLEIDDVRLIVAELELEGSEGACDADGEDDGDDDECPDFEAPPFFLDLPLDGSGVDVVSDRVPEGTYRELEFEVEDVELDEDDEDEEEIATLATEVRGAFPDWPAEASLRIAGTFTPTDDEPAEYATYFDAEVEVELDLDPPLEITADGPSRVLTVRVRPDIWFVRPDGSVTDLSALQDADELPELEVEMEDGFTEIEIEED